jgi:uncharacterized membrane protein
MARAFDLFAFLTMLVLVTGGFVWHSAHLFLDLASVDSFAIGALVLLLLGWEKVRHQSRMLEFADHEIRNVRMLENTKIFYWAVFGFLFLAHVAKHWSLLTDGFDVSFVHQALFNPFGHSVSEGARASYFPADISPSGSALGEHLLFSLVPLSLVTQFIRYDEFLFLIQNLSIAIPLYFLIFKSPLTLKIGSWFWLAVLVILANASLRHSMVFDFREDSFAFLGLTIAILSLLSGRVSWYFFGFLFALLSKEHVFIITLSTAPIILWVPEFKLDRRKRILLALATGTISLVYGFIAFKYLLPAFNPELKHGVSPIVARLHQFGDTPAHILTNVVIHPANWWMVLQNVFTKTAITYLFKMLIPLAPFLFLGNAWIIALPGFAGMALNILTGYPGQTSMQFHYDLVVLPFLFTGLLIGIGKSKLTTQKAIACILLALAFSSKWPVYEFTHFFPTRAEAMARVALLKLDAREAVLTDAHLSAQMNQHASLVILDDHCEPYFRKPNVDFKGDNFIGYIVFDQRNPVMRGCVQVSGTPIFTNSEIEIFEKGLNPGMRAGS